MRLPILFLALTVFPFVSLKADGGFEDPVLLGKVKNGEIVIQNVIDTQYESKKIIRSFFPKTSSDVYLDLTVNYPKYPDLFEEVQSGELLSVNENKTIYQYKLDVIVGSGIFKQHVYPEGEHTLMRASDAHSPSRVSNKLTNFQDMIEVGEQSVTITPHESGILVEDTVHIRVNPSAAYAKMMKTKLTDFLVSYTEKLRQELNGGY